MHLVLTSTFMRTQMAKFSELGAWVDLHVKMFFVTFTHNPIHNLGNHYDAILMKPDFQNLDLLLNTAVSEIIQPPSSNKPPPSVHVQHQQPAHQQAPPPSDHRQPRPPFTHQQPPPQAVQDDSLPIDLSMKSANTTPTAPKPEVNDENLDDVDDNQNIDDVDDDQPVVIE